MPINRMLDDSFGPDDIVRLNRAFQIALKALNLVDRNDPITEIVAKKIIEINGSGLRDPKQISLRAIQELGLP